MKKYYIVFFQSTSKDWVKVGNVAVEARGFLNPKVFQDFVKNNYPEITSTVITGILKITKAEYEIWSEENAQ